MQLKSWGGKVGVKVEINAEEKDGQTDGLTDKSECHKERRDRE